MPRLWEVYPGIRLTTEGKARKNLSQGSRRMPVGKEYTEQSIRVNKNYIIILYYIILYYIILYYIILYYIILYYKRQKGKVYPRTGHEGPEGE